MADRDKIEKLKVEYPTQGWELFLVTKKEMLDSYDRAREKSKSHKMETYHGRVAEAEFRKWLLSFLPKRYGVTSGYIVSPGMSSKAKLIHFDVIIYDQLDSPILWIESSPDTSQQGRSLAIPVEYVYCVLEVKSNFTSSTVEDAINHLKELLPLLNGINEKDNPFKLYLPSNFCCGLVFFNLHKEHQFSETALRKIIFGNELRGFFGGVILRGEGHDKNLTGRIMLARSKTPNKGSISPGNQSLMGYAQSDTIQMSNGEYLSSMIYWFESNFSQFGFEIIAWMQGNLKYQFFPSLYGMGQSRVRQ